MHPSILVILILQYTQNWKLYYPEFTSKTPDLGQITGKLYNTSITSIVGVLRKLGTGTFTGLNRQDNNKPIYCTSTFHNFVANLPVSAILV